MFHFGGITTTSIGAPGVVATVSTQLNQAAIAATTAYTTTAAGVYRVSWIATITQAATTSCILGGAAGFQVKYTNFTDSVVKTTNPTTVIVSAVNATGTAIGGDMIISCAASTAIQYIMGYTSVGVTPMIYDLLIKIESL